jgi:hypothetical protein
MHINIMPVVACAVLSMVLGFVWYGPLFGKKWMSLMKHDGDMSEEKKKEMMRGMQTLYLTQFILTLFQVYVLSWYVTILTGISSGVHTAFSIWIAFIVPTVAGACMWNNESRKTAWTRFLIQAGYQLVAFIMFGYILGMWK